MKIRQDDEGRVTIAKSRKLPNTRLNLKDAAMAQVCGGVVSVAANMVFSMGISPGNELPGLRRETSA